MSDPTEAQLLQEKLDKETRAGNAHKTWRYRYREGAKPEGKLFNHPDDVPEGEGWVDSPAKCQEPPERSDPEDAHQTKNVEDRRPPESIKMSALRDRYAEVTDGGKIAVGVGKAEAQEMIRDAVARNNAA